MEMIIVVCDTLAVVSIIAGLLSSKFVKQA